MVKNVFGKAITVPVFFRAFSHPSTCNTFRIQPTIAIEARCGFLRYACTLSWVRKLSSNSGSLARLTQATEHQGTREPNAVYFVGFTTEITAVDCVLAPPI